MSRFLRDRYCSLRAYVPGEQPRIPGLLKLNTNESPYPPSPEVLKALNSEEVGRLNLYSDPSISALKEAIAGRFSVSREQVLAGNGSDEVLAFAFQAFTGKGALFPDITYGFYPVWCVLYGIPYREILVASDYTVNTGDYTGNGEMIVIANPNAPTGIALPLQSIREILDMNTSGIVVVDEAYVDFGAESASVLLPEYENLLVVQTFSKSRCLAGGRIGFALGAPELIADLELIRCSFHPYNINRLSILAGEAAIRDVNYFESCRKAIMADRDYTAASLCDLGFEVLPSLANFVFARHPAIGGAGFCRELRKRAILVRHFDGARIQDFNRISIGTRIQMERMITAAADILKGA